MRLALVSLVAAALIATACSGSSVAAPEPRDTTIATIGRNQDAGWYPALALTSELHPVISHTDAEDRNLEISICDDPSCTDSITIVGDAEGNVGWYSSIALTDDNRPVVAYTAVTDKDLKVLVCDDPRCTSYSTVVADAVGEVGAYTSIALDGQGRPIVAYFDYANESLMLLACGDDRCSGDNSVVTVDADIAVGWFNSLTLTDDDRPVIAYYDIAGENLRVAVCSARTCSASPTITRPDTAGDVGWYPSIELDDRGHPVVSYHDYTNGDLKLLRCGDPTCLEGNEISRVDETGDTGLFTQMQLDSAGAPVIAHFHADYDEVRLLVCADADCGGDRRAQRLDASAYDGRAISMVLDPHGRPIVAHHRPGDGLVVVTCGDAVCTPAPR